MFSRQCSIAAGVFEDQIFAKIGRQKRRTRNGKHCDTEGNCRDRNLPHQAAILRHFLFVMGGMDDTTRTKTQKCLEEGMGNQVE